MSSPLPSPQDSAQRFKTEVLRSYLVSFTLLGLLSSIAFIGIIALSFSVKHSAGVRANAQLGEQLLHVLQQLSRLENANDADLNAAMGALKSALDSHKKNSAEVISLNSCDELLSMSSSSTKLSAAWADLTMGCAADASAHVLALQNHAAPPSTRYRILQSLFMAWIIRTHEALMYLGEASNNPSAFLLDPIKVGQLQVSMATQSFLRVLLDPNFSDADEVRLLLSDISNVTSVAYKSIQSTLPELSKPPQSTTNQTLQLYFTEAQQELDGLFIDTRGAIEITLFSIGLLACILTALAVHLTIRVYISGIALSRQLAHDFTSSEVTKNLLEVYGKAFQNFDLHKVETPLVQGSIIESVYRRVLQAVQNVKCFLPQTLFAGASLADSKLRIDSTMTLRDSITVLTIRVSLSESNVKASDYEFVLSDVIDVVQSVVSESNGLMHAMVGCTIVVTWNGTIPVENAATLALKAAETIADELSQFDELGPIAMGISHGPGLISNIKTHRKRHVTLISGAAQVGERLVEIALHFEEWIVFDASVYAALPRGSFGKYYYRPVCVVPQRNSESEIVVYTLVQATSMNREQLKLFAQVFSLFLDKEYDNFIKELKRYVSLYREDKVAQRLLEITDDYDVLGVANK